ncbi:MAG: DNA alkylation repair protein [Candidatus Krumholzibacteria bacterium]|jgi:3-methyladenine DNA glycosylase AlkD|nr:DNA alkylation repair protein [Candidatus Krumholzibacteria bacterium]MDP6798081.1 DNA alkylation repair protein [Candidatus Krumholzibacteria bacterium]MDP7022014.1 DNA alkylation repair protein [Candidatus Krumholzibacteria bacterium]
MKDLVQFVQGELEKRADPEKAGPMAAYMKTRMPFYGVQKKGRDEIAQAFADYHPNSLQDYEKVVLSLWSLPHREEKYLAINFAIRKSDFIQPASLPLYEKLIREGAWWDFVDSIAISLVGVALRENRKLWKSMDRWIEDEDFWIRRTAILFQARYRSDTDEDQLFDYCLRSAGEKEFFIRKAIGWALREYSYARPERVKGFLLENRELLSGLSYREGARKLIRDGLMKKPAPPKRRGSKA